MVVINVGKRVGLVVYLHLLVCNAYRMSERENYEQLLHVHVFDQQSELHIYSGYQFSEDYESTMFDPA